MDSQILVTPCILYPSSLVLFLLYETRQDLLYTYKPPKEYQKIAIISDDGINIYNT